MKGSIEDRGARRGEGSARLLAAPLALALALSTAGLAACAGRQVDKAPDLASSSSSSGSSSSAERASSSEAPATPAQQDAAALDTYRAVLAELGTQGAWVDYLTPTGVYLYSLVTLQAGEGPSMLLAQEEDNGTYLARVYYFDEDASQLYAPEGEGNLIQFGVASVGGLRASLGTAADGNGLLLTSLSSGTGDGSVDRITRDGNTLVTTHESDFEQLQFNGPEEGPTIQ